MNNIITISRQYSSGGREIAEKLAKAFDIPFYDNELITIAAKESGFAEEAFHMAEKKATNSLLYSIAMGMNAYGNQDLGFANLSIDDKIYLAQSNVIRRVAEQGPCVIVGRCADYVLKDLPNVLHVFVMADMPFRVQRAIYLDEMSPERIEDNILKIDKRRANYYNYHSCETWGKADNYHLSINSSRVGIDKAVECIKMYAESFKQNA